MTELKYRIEPEIFRQFPGYRRGVVLAHGLTNRPSPESLVLMMRQQEEELRERLDYEHILEEPHIQVWREAYRQFGAKPSDFRPSVEALVRRVLKGEKIPTINSLVDIGNMLSVKHLIPTGGHAIDRLEEDISLRIANGNETFVSLGSEIVEHPLPGEVIFAEGDHVLTRRWTWRQGKRTLTQLDTTAIEFNVDGLPPTTEDEVEAVCEEIVALVSKFCDDQGDAAMQFRILTEKYPPMGLGVFKR
jgi:DNA/RNA-binding domain of Phe-tRNA-synthetase-like protein